MLKARDYWKTSKKIFGNYKYTSFFIIVTLAFYLLNVLFFNYKDFFTFSREFGFLTALSLFFKGALNFLNVLPWYSSYGIVILSFLTGLFFTLVFYKIKQIGKMGNERNFLGAFGVALGIISSGCASCGLGILGILGLSSALAVLPLKGLEISIIAILILAVSIVYTMNKITYNVCKTQIHKNERRLKNE